jgi:hypothetical protein
MGSTWLLSASPLVKGEFGKEQNMEQVARTDAFESVKDQIGYCGIWCGSCVVGNGTLRDLTRMYRPILDGYGVLEWGPKDFDSLEFLKGLESVANLPVCPGCLKGGGRDNCELRSCALSKGIDGCDRCDTIETCGHKEILDHMRTGSLAAGLFVNTENQDKQELIETWTADLKKRLPCCILFADG